MSLFTNKSQTKQSQVLQETATKAISVFQTTIKQLQSVISSANDSKASNEKTIEDLKNENAKLTKVVEDNTIIVRKLSDLFNPEPSSSSDGNV